MRELTPKMLEPDAKAYLKSEAKGLLSILLKVLGEQLIKILVGFLVRHNDTKVVGLEDENPR